MPTTKNTTTTVKSLRNGDAANAVVKLDSSGAPVALTLTADGETVTVKVGAADWQAGAVAALARLAAVQVSTPAGHARWLNRACDGKLRATAPNGRYWTSRDL
jgi:hypothetical protein